MISVSFGNSTIPENLKKILENGNIPHAFLIEGGSLESRIETAEYIAKAVVCEGEKKPCGVCKQCRLCENGANADISFITPEKDKKFISVGQIRTLREEAFIKPHSAEKRVFVIENSELMNEQSQNALLKVLEEPPKSVVFVLLTTSKSILLQTVISRCSIFKLSEGEDINGEELKNKAEEFLRLLFSSEEYEMLKLLEPFEKDRIKSESFFRAVQRECIIKLSEGGLSNFRSKALSRIYDQTEEYISLIYTNINMPLLFSAAVCRYKSFLN